MPGLVRKLIIFAAADGLVLQPISRREQHPIAAIKIDYANHAIAPVSKDSHVNPQKATTLEVHGIVGLLTTSYATYLISIVNRQRVAQLWGKPVYVIKDVSIIPITTQSDAEKSINKSLQALRDREFIEEAEIPTDGSTLHELTDADSSPATKTDAVDDRLKSNAISISQTEDSKTSETSSIAENVIHKKGLYGRFAEQWFSNGGWSRERRRSLGVAGSENLNTTASLSVSPANLAPGLSSLEQARTGQNASPSPTRATERMSRSDTSSSERMKGIAGRQGNNLLSKLVATTSLLFGSSTFFFSHEVDITHSLATRPALTTDTPLYKQAESQYFWNQHLVLPFIKGGFEDFVVPVMQGFINQKEFAIESKATEISSQTSNAPPVPAAIRTGHEDEHEEHPLPLAAPKGISSKSFLLTLISRRSVKRSGLRYLRRGIDEDGNTANSVETEQILSSPDWNGSEAVYSFLQVRGSIPLFFSQTPYSFKPIPAAHGSAEANRLAFKKHFSSLVARYGSVHAVSLLDTHGNEAKIGESYRDNAEKLNADGGLSGRKIDFQWFDFHNVCKGMKFENVSQLLAHQSSFLSECGWTVQLDGTAATTQRGIIRTNCMDCLDRTNVVQSAFARYILEKQLADEGVSINLEKDPSTTWFNILWADNGDAISRAYAGTSALKGDYTRTRKRNIGGALTDLTLTMSRYYQNIFNDFFGQACIDYLLGNVTENVFEEFETNMMSADPAMDLGKLRQHAIDTCVKVVVEEHEDLVAGWPMSCPQQPNTIKTAPFEECLLLLTDAALYACRFDWNTEKVQSFERVPLEQISNIRWGTYITSTLAPAHIDEKLNVGLVIGYKPTGKALVRVNTRSLQNEATIPTSSSKEMDGGTSENRILAFKALSNRSSAMNNTIKDSWAQSEYELVRHICNEIERAAEHNSQSVVDYAEPKHAIKVETKAIISLEEARKSTGYLETLGYSLKKLVWG